MRGIMSCVTQEELKSKKAHIETRETAKGAVLEDDTKLTKIVKASMYDSMVSE